ncbi:hypothetical protein AFK24_15235 [Pseudomonas syringae]|uniref:Uncharacterized protein n=1 Tax=Pseudomonas syringae TaxID=317 RepID=A0A1C7Z576_PSESX|nr:hypothetical protein [Pseudomonas syringae]OCR24117.1 hypothetical protein AFK24_15235 [Pseudomonas syringae]
MSESASGKIGLAALPDQVALPVAQIKQSHDLALGVDDVGDNGALAVVPIVAALEIGDSMTLHWKGFYDGIALIDWSGKFTFDDSNTKGPALFSIERSHVLIIEDGYAEINYQIDFASGVQSDESPTQTVHIVPPVAERLQAPYIDGHDSNQPIDPGRYPEGITVQFAAYPGMQLDDHVVLYGDGVRDAGSVVMALRIEASHIEAGAVAFSIGPEWLQANQGEKVEVFYQYARPGVAATSEALSLSVLLPLDLPPAVVEKAQAEGLPGQNEGYLLARDATSGVYVNVSESVLLGENDDLEVHWQGHPSGGRHIAQTPVSPDVRTRFLVPASAVAANMGGDSKRFDVFYRFTPFNGHAQDSRPFHLHIRPLDQERYPIIQWPRLAGAATLSLKTVAASGEDLQLGLWPFMAEGQLVTIEASGVAATGAPTRITVRDAQGVSKTEMTQRKVMSKLALGFLRTLKLNEYITVTPQISFDGGDTFFGLASNNGVKLVD